MTTVVRYEQCLRELWDEPRSIVFAAGPTVRGNQPHLTSWRIEAEAAFNRQGFDGILIVPEFTSRVESDKGKLWIPAWEFAGLNVSDVNLFWVPRTKELIGLTTNHEKGYWLAEMHEKLVYGRPDDSYRNTYLDLMWAYNAIQKGYKLPSIHSSLDALVAVAIEKADRETKIHRVKSRVHVDSPYGAFLM